MDALLADMRHMRDLKLSVKLADELRFLLLTASNVKQFLTKMQLVQRAADASAPAHHLAHHIEPSRPPRPFR